MKNFLSKNFPFLLMIGVAIFAIPSLKKLFSFASESNKGAQDNNAAIVNDLQKFVAPAEKAKFVKSETYLKQVAERQYMAMLDKGTDEDELFSSLQGLNTAELKAVAAYFGQRSSLFLNLIPLFTGNIFDWYRDELDDADFKKMQGIWINTGLI